MCIHVAESSKILSEKQKIHCMPLQRIRYCQVTVFLR